MRRRWPLLVLILAPLFALWPGLTGLAVGPFDAIRQLPPWNGPKPAQPWDVLMADSVLQSHVWRTLVLDAWGKGQLPLWNPYEFAGTPLLANSQSGGFYPPHIVLGLLHFSAGFAGFLLAWFHLALAGLGMFALVRRLGGSPAGGLTAGLSFGLSPFLLGWTPLSSVLATVAWIPLALACVTQSEDRRSLAALSACVGMMLLAGHLQFAAYGIGAVALFAAFRLPLSSLRGTRDTNFEMTSGDERGLGGEARGRLALPPTPSRRRATSRGGVAVLFAISLGGALAAPQLLPVLSYSKESHRRNTPSEEGYQAYVASAIKPYELATLAHPMALGSPREPVDVGGTTVAAYWPALQNRNFAESAVSLGAVVLALLFAVPWRRRETWPLAAVGGLAFLLALGTPLNRLLYFFVPGWSSTGSPGRIEVVFVLCACALAGLAVDRLAERRAFILATVGAVVGMLLAIVLPNLATADGAAAALRGAATAGAMIPILLATAGTVLALFLAKRTLWAVPAGALIVALLTHATGLVPFGAPLARVPGDPNTRIAVVNGDWEIPVAPQALMPPNLAALSGLHELAGYDSLTSHDAVDMLRAANGGTDPAPPANGNLMFVKPSLDPKILAEDGVTEVWSRKPLPQLGVPEQREGYVVYRIANPLGTREGTVDVGYDRIEVHAAPGGMVLGSDRLTQGWSVERTPPSASVDLRRHPGWSIAIPQSKPTGFDAEFRYAAPGLRLGEIIGALAWLALLGMALIPRQSRDRTRDAESNV